MSMTANAKQYVAVTRARVPGQPENHGNPGKMVEITGNLIGPREKVASLLCFVSCRHSVCTVSLAMVGV